MEQVLFISYSPTDMRLSIVLLLACLLTACSANRPTKAGLYKHTGVPEFAKQK